MPSIKSLLFSTVLFSFSFAAPAADSLAPRQSRPPPSIPATIFSTYDASSGKVAYDTWDGYVFRDFTSSSASGTSVTTLLTFNIQSSSNLEGKKCKFEFWFNPASPGSESTGSHMFELYTSLAPASPNPVNGPVGNNQRGSFLGLFYVSDNAAKGSQVAAMIDGTDTINCPTSTYGMEMAGAGNQDKITWLKNEEGNYAKLVVL